MTHLPCKKCGSSLPIVKGSIVQCHYCRAENLYKESYYTLKYYISDILKLSSLRKAKKVNFKEIVRRKIIIDNYFVDLKSNFKKYRHLIITKLDSVTINPVKLFYLIRSAGNLELIIDQFLLKYLDDEISQENFVELRDKAYIMNKSLLGLYYSFLAKNTNRFRASFRFYQYAEKNYQNVVDYCKIINLGNNNSLFYKISKFYSVLVKFTNIIRNILDKNPKLFTNELEELLKELEDIYKNNIHAYNLYKQIENIVQLERKTCVLLENIREDDPFISNETVNEASFKTDEENLNELIRIRNWINNLSEKYQKYQNSLLKLHSGRIIKYLRSYRKEFISYKHKNAEKFDDIVGSMINKALKSYNNQTLEALETLNLFMQKNIFNENLLDKFEIGHDELIEMDDVLQKFVNDLFKKPLLRNLESEYYKKLISIISGKHTEYDQYILKFVNRMLKDFEDMRNKNDMSLNDQRRQFISQIKPNLQKLIDLSFTLNEEILPYPLFIDIKNPNQKLKINSPESLTLLIENPNITDIKNIKIHFIIPKSIQSRLKFTHIQKLKANERRKIKVKINPKERGEFSSMVMIEYQHYNKTFWMPSLKFKLVVEESKKFIQYPSFYKDYYQVHASNTFKFIRDRV